MAEVTKETWTAEFEKAYQSLRHEYEKAKSRYYELAKELEGYEIIRKVLQGDNLPESGWKWPPGSEPEAMYPGIPAADITAKMIRKAATQLLQQAGLEGMKAADITRRIVPNYDPKDDGRAFENRVFATLSRPDGLFVKIARGVFVSREFFRGQHEPPQPGTRAIDL